MSEASEGRVAAQKTQLAGKQIVRGHLEGKKRLAQSEKLARRWEWKHETNLELVEANWESFLII